MIHLQVLIQKIMVGGVKQAEFDYGGPRYTVHKAKLSSYGVWGMTPGNFLKLGTSRLNLVEYFANYIQLYLSPI